MCIGFPGLVTAVDSMGATVDTEGRSRRASTLLIPDIAVGDWVFVAAGSIVDRLDPAEARQIRAMLLDAIALEKAEAGAPTKQEESHGHAS
ncbi:MAG: HypC/HybG/HupF family hydrogenase formation chaperone [Chloroflexota bacterium]|nr:HypC/HybG/HupF family hydrogenase formation chaperone [Chloroflexota bacterium]